MALLACVLSLVAFPKAPGGRLLLGAADAVLTDPRRKPHPWRQRRARVDVPALRRRLLRWYDSNRRDLAWRRTRDPYAIWVSEVMLQQTRVDVATPYFRRWMARFPTVQDLAAADSEEVLRMWSGLGYYSRARNLHAAAKAVVQRHGGQVPDQVHALLELPGIGPYTAAAIASIAFGRRAAVVDGNVERVVARVALLRGDPKRGPTAANIHGLAQAWLAPRRTGDWNQAVMDLGATICTPRAPRCPECPLAALCAARAAGVQDQLPETARAARPKVERHRFAVVRKAGKVLLVRNPPTGLLAELWSLPGGQAGRTLSDLVLEQAGLQVLVTAKPAKARHQFSHRTWVMDIHGARLAGGRTTAAAQREVRWVRPDDLAGEALPTAMRTALAAAGIPAKAKRRAASAGPKMNLGPRRQRVVRRAGGPRSLAPLVAAAALLVMLADAAAAAPGPAVTVLLHHPDDGVDPFGFAFAGADGFTARYGQFADADGRFPYPFFVADGAIPIAALPDPKVPYESTLQAYGQAVAARQSEESPVALLLSSTVGGGVIRAVATVKAATGASLEAEDLHLWFAIAEDPVRYQPPTGLTNGVIDHRFTVRALADEGRLDLANGTVVEEWAVPIGDWNVENLLVAAWVQQETPSGRFDSREIVQATHAAVGTSVEQTAKGVLVEVLSATWCDPCLYGDLAAEDLAVSLGAAEPLAAQRVRYFETPANAWLVVALSVGFGLAIARTGRRGHP